MDLIVPASTQYQQILNRINSVLQVWQKRQLSLLGKILIVNTLAGSMMVYLLQVLPSPNAETLKHFNKLIQDFLWKGKRPKIKLTMLQSNYEQGGVRLVNLVARNASLKIPWIFKEHSLVDIQLEQIIPEELGTLFWDCSLASKDIKGYLEIAEAMNSGRK